MMKYYTNQKVLSYNHNIIFSVGQRGIGKSYDWKRHAIHKFLKNKRKFIFIERYEKDKKTRAKTYFNNMLTKKYKDYEIKYQASNFYIRPKNKKVWQLMGYCIDINTMSSITSSSYEDVDLILFDEFMNLSNKYIKDKDNPLKEPEIMQSFYQTVARGVDEVVRNNVKMVFLSNAVTLSNPYFIFYEIDKKLRIGMKKLRLKDKDIIVELPQIKEIKTLIEKSKFFKSFKNKKYNDFALLNTFYLDNNAVIKKINKNYKPRIKFICDNKTYILYEYKNNFIFSDKNSKKEMLTFSITEKDYKQDYFRIDKLKKYMLYDNIKNAFLDNNIFFENQTCYQNFLFIFSLM